MLAVVRHFFILISLVLASSHLSFAISSKDSKTVKGVGLVAKDLLNETNALVQHVRDYYRTFLADPEFYNKVREKVLARQTQIDETYLLALDGVRQPLQEKSASESQDQVVDFLRQFSTEVENLPNFYSHLACLTPGGPGACIGGAWARRRDAIVGVIYAQSSDIQFLRSLNFSTAGHLQGLANDLSPDNLYFGAGLEFGLPHFLTRRFQRLAQLKLALNHISALLTGQDLTGYPLISSSPCQPSSPVPSLAEELQLIGAAAQSGMSHFEWLSQFLEGRFRIYDGDESGPGLIAKWDQCIDSKLLQIDVLRSQFDLAQQNGQIANLAPLDASIYDLLSEVSRLVIEREFIEFRRSQLLNISNAQSSQYEEGVTDDMSWRLTVSQQALSIQANLPNYLRVVKALGALVHASDSKLHGIAAAANSQIFIQLVEPVWSFTNSAATTGVAEIEIIDRHASELSSLAANISALQVGGIAPFSQSASNLQQLTSYIQQREMLVHNQFTAASSGYEQAKELAEQALIEKQEIAANLNQFDLRVGDFVSFSASLESILSDPNKIFLFVVDRFKDRLASEARYKKLKPHFAKSFSKLLKSFKNPSNKIENVMTCSKGQGLCKDDFVFKAFQFRSALNVPEIVDAAVASQANGSKLIAVYAQLLFLNSQLLNPLL